MSRRHPRGFTLLEASIVIGLIMLLSTGIYLTMRGRLETALSQRTGDELSLLSRLSVVELKRGLRKAPQGNWEYKTHPSALGLPVSAAVPLCFNLASIEGRGMASCQSIQFSSGTPSFPANWNARYTVAALRNVPANASLLATLGNGQSVSNQGYNPWCLPYVVCFYPFRTEVLTCVPESLEDSIADSVLSCGVCNVSVPGANTTSRCVMKESSAFSKSSPGISLSYSTESNAAAMPPVFDTTVTPVH